jgi:type II restriction/modification system DNA methylase subunit YeeA
MPNMQKLILGTQKASKSCVQYFFIPLIVLFTNNSSKVIDLLVNEIPNPVQNDVLIPWRQVDLLVNNTNKGERWQHLDRRTRSKQKKRIPFGILSIIIGVMNAK